MEHITFMWTQFADMTSYRDRRTNDPYVHNSDMHVLWLHYIMVSKLALKGKLEAITMMASARCAKYNLMRCAIH